MQMYICIWIYIDVYIYIDVQTRRSRASWAY